jgi:hypothetical protein
MGSKHIESIMKLPRNKQNPLMEVHSQPTQMERLGMNHLERPVLVRNFSITF